MLHQLRVHHALCLVELARFLDQRHDCVCVNLVPEVAAKPASLGLRLCQANYPLVPLAQLLRRALKCAKRPVLGKSPCYMMPSSFLQTSIELRCGSRMPASFIDVRLGAHVENVFDQPDDALHVP